MRGTVIGVTLGNYQIVSTIGEGGMGVVYRAEHVLIGRKAAVKLLQSKMSSDPELVDRFFNEARAAALIRHPGLVEAFDFGYADDGRAYIVMELLEGEALTQRIARDVRLSVPTALAIARQVANALHAAHEVGIVHRDLKPENIHLVADPEAAGHVRTKVLDFGIAKLAQPEDRRSVKTRTGAVFGTPRYMSPEQARNATNVDRRTDIYALGCIMFEMILGTPPFDHDSWAELVAAHLHEQPPRPRELDPSLAPELEAILLRAIAKPVAERFATMAELIHAIETYWRRDSADPLLVTPASQPVMTAASSTAPTLPVTGELSAPPPRRRAPWMIGGFAITIAGGFALMIALNQSEPERAQVATQPADAASVDAPAPPPPPPPPPASEVVGALPREPVKVRLVVDSVPAGAEVYRSLDAVKLGKTPLVVELDRIAGQVDLVLRLRGFRDARLAMSTATDGQSRTKLVRMPLPPKRPPRTGPTVLDPYGGDP
jgi:eukaryotic-like serine/threonine-protein kinase